MAIQDDLKMSFNGSKNTVDGLVDMGSLAEDCIHLITTEMNCDLPLIFFSFYFIPMTVFAFHLLFICVLPNDGCKRSRVIFFYMGSNRKAVDIEFTVNYLCFDDASNNLAFQLMHFENKEEAKSHNFTAKNPFGGNQVTPS